MQRGIQHRWPETLLIVYWVTLMTATHWPKLPGLDIPGKDKTAHVVAYALLAGLATNVAARRLARDIPPKASSTGVTGGRGSRAQSRGLSASAVALRIAPKYRSLLIALGTIALVAIAGGLDERTQPWANRHCDLYDWLADIAGGSLVSLVYLVLTWLRTPASVEEKIVEVGG